MEKTQRIRAILYLIKKQTNVFLWNLTIKTRFNWDQKIVTPVTIKEEAQFKIATQ